MKLLCIITAFIVVLLSVKPCCTDERAVAKRGIEKNDPDAADKDCDSCSPFSCGTCVSFVLSTPTTPINVPHAVAVLHNSIYQRPYLEEIAASIWQPPKLS